MSDTTGLGASLDARPYGCISRLPAGSDGDIAHEAAPAPRRAPRRGRFAVSVKSTPGTPPSPAARRRVHAAAGDARDGARVGSSGQKLGREAVGDRRDGDRRLESLT